MSNGVFMMDGVDYDIFVTKLERNFEVSDSDSSGRTKDWVMHRDVVGTFYNYTIEFEMHNYNLEAYSAFYQAISSPTAQHVLTFPYNGETITFNAYCTKGKDTLKIRNGKNIWSGLSVNFIAMEPQRLA